MCLSIGLVLFLSALYTSLFLSLSFSCTFAVVVVVVVVISCHSLELNSS